MQHLLQHLLEILDNFGGKNQGLARTKRLLLFALRLGVFWRRKSFGEFMGNWRRTDKGTAWNSKAHTFALQTLNWQMSGLMSQTHSRSLAQSKKADWKPILPLGISCCSFRVVITQICTQSACAQGFCQTCVRCSAWKIWKVLSLLLLQTGCSAAALNRVRTPESSIRMAICYSIARFLSGCLHVRVTLVWLCLCSTQYYPKRKSWRHG